jgi:hypothetical protein
MESVPIQSNVSPGGERPEPVSFDTDDETPTRKKKRRADGPAPASRPVGETGNGSAGGSVVERSGLLRRLLGGEDGSRAAGPRAESTGAKEAAGPLPVETLTPDEAQYIIRRLVRTDQVAGREVSATADAETLAAEAAVAEFHARLLDDAEPLQDAFVETMQALGVEVPADDVTSEASTAEAVAAEPAEIVTEAREQTWWPSAADHEETPETILLRSTAPTPGEHDRPVSADATEADDDPTAPAVTPSAPGAPRILPARRDSVAGLPWPEVTRDRWDGSDVVGAALVGGMVSYLVGRRRGRIKTERRLLPIQKKLEQQVKNLRRDLRQKETVIRGVAADQARQRLAEAYPGRPAAAPVVERRTSQPESRVSPAAAPEKQQLGKFLLSAAEAPLAAAASNHEKQERQVTRPAESLPLSGRLTERRDASAKAPKIERTPPIPLAKHVETMRQEDLLELSSKIVVEGASLKQIYESRQIGERALRRIVGEHLRGGDVRKALRNERIQHEIDFERDPILRDRDHAVSSAEGGGKALDSLLQRADVTMDQRDNEHLAALKSRADNRLRQQASRQQQQQLVTATLSTTIVVLILVVIFLLVKR